MIYKNLIEVCGVIIKAAEQKNDSQLMNFYTRTLYNLLNGNATKNDGVNMRMAYVKYLEDNKVSEEKRAAINEELNALAAIDEDAKKEYKVKGY